MPIALSFRGQSRLAVEPLLHSTPYEQQLLGCWFDVVNVLLDLISPHQIADGSRGHLYPFTQFCCGEIFFHCRSFGFELVLPFLSSA